MSASCGAAGGAQRAFLVIGQVLPLKIDVLKTGWSIRPSGRNTRVSYGVLLGNTSKVENAENVEVLVNFVMPDNRLIGSASGRLREIRAETQHAYGGELTFPGAPPIERLEVVVQVHERAPRTERVPALSAIRIVPEFRDPVWVGSVEGEIANDDPAVMRSADLTTIIFDAEGNILGGGRGSVTASLPPAAREFFKIGSGLDAIPTARAATALVSVAPRYED